ncbi:MAG: hypothetical protein AAF527_05490 [Pseudomonadota bacterium]
MTDQTSQEQLGDEQPATRLEELTGFLASIKPKSSKEASNALAAAFPHAALALRLSACAPYAKQAR